MTVLSCDNFLSQDIFLSHDSFYPEITTQEARTNQLNKVDRCYSKFVRVFNLLLGFQTNPLYSRPFWGLCSIIPWHVLMIIKTFVISLGPLCFSRPLKSVMHQSMLSPRVGGLCIPRGIWHFSLFSCQSLYPGRKHWCQIPLPWEYILFGLIW